MLCVFNGYMCSGYRSSDFHKFDAKCSSLQVDYLSGRFPLRSLRNIMRVCLATCAVKIRYWPRHARYLRVTLVKSYVTRETLMRETCVSRAYSSQTTCKIDCKGINYFRKMRVPSKLPANCTVYSGKKLMDQGIQRAVTFLFLNQISKTLYYINRLRMRQNCLLSSFARLSWKRYRGCFGIMGSFSKTRKITVLSVYA